MIERRESVGAFGNSQAVVLSRRELAVDATDRGQQHEPER